MNKDSLKVGKNTDFSSLETIFDVKDLETLEKIKELIEPLKKKYGFSLNKIESILEKELMIPNIIFNEELTALESVVKYLKENKNFPLKKISDVIKRDQRNVWNIYNQAWKKCPKKFIVKNVKYGIPISIFSDKFSAYESLVKYLKEELELKFSEIAEILKRDQRTIWTIYSRSGKKVGLNRGKNKNVR